MSNPALWTAVAAVITAAGGVLALFVHTHNHQEGGGGGAQNQPGGPSDHQP